MNAEIRDAERQVIEAAEAFLATWQKVGTLSNAYDAADDVIRAVRALRRTPQADRSRSEEAEPRAMSEAAAILTVLERIAVALERMRA